LKPENILLKMDFNAKIVAEVGMVGRRGFFLLPPLLSFFFLLKFAEGGA
jgi:hypothetical protein